MDTITVLGLIVGILGAIFGIIGVGLAVYSTRQFTKGVKIGSLQYIRTLINRMEEEKGKQPMDSPQWTAMHHTQQDLDALFKSLQTMFDVPDKEAPPT
jgi:Tfp pilus assembly protein PilV